MIRNDWSNDKLFFKLLNNKTEKAYWDNIHALRKRPIKEVFERSIELTYSNENIAKQIGIHILAQLGSTPRPFYVESNTRFFELLASENDPQILASLLISIGHNNERISKNQIEQLCSLGDTENTEVKTGLIHALLGIDNAKAIDILIKLSSDKSGHVRDWATFVLGSINKRNNRKIREALWARVNDKYEEAKFEAIAGMAQRKDTRVIEIIKRELLTEQYGSLLFEAIIAIDGKEFLPILKLQLKENRGNQQIDAYWLEGLEDCINELEGRIVA